MRSRQRLGGLTVFSTVAVTAGSAAMWKKAGDLDSQEQKLERKNKPTRGTNTNGNEI
jgi:hypothetical protein